MAALPPAGSDDLRKLWYFHLVVSARFAGPEFLPHGSVKINIYGQRAIVAVDLHKLHECLGPLQPNGSLFAFWELSGLWANVDVAFVSSMLEAKVPMMRFTAIGNTSVRIPWGRLTAERCFNDIDVG